MQFPKAQIVQAVTLALGGKVPLPIDATAIATALLGDAIASNLFMLGFAWQQGLVPLSLESITRAIELNGAAVAMNVQAFAWGRIAAGDPQRVREAAALAPTTSAVTAPTLAHAQLSQKHKQPFERCVCFLGDSKPHTSAQRH